MSDSFHFSDADLEAIKARTQAATPGPWEHDTDRDHDGIGWSYVRMPDDGPRPRVDARHRDAEFIAHARTDVPALVAEVERLRSELETVNAENYRLRGGAL